MYTDCPVISEAVKEMARKAREDQESLHARLAELEKLLKNQS